MNKKKYKAIVCIIISIFYSALAWSANKTFLRFEIYNYINQTLPYIAQDVVVGELYLPDHISQAPNNGAPTIAQSLIQSDQLKQAVGSFKIGIDENNYCEFTYNIQASLPIQPVNSLGQLANRCQVDPDTHRHIIINQQ